MSNSKPPNDFAERLRRIEERRTAPAQTPAQPQRRNNTAAAPTDRHLLRNLVIWLVIGAGLGTGGYFAWKSVPPEMSASFASLTAGLDMSRILPVNSMGGGSWQASGPAGAGERGANPVTPQVASNLPDPVTLADLVTDHVLTDENTVIGQIIPFDRNSQCNLRRPLASEQVVNIRLENGTLTPPVRAISDSDLVKQLVQNVTDVTQKGRSYNWSAQVTGDLTSVDVFLTDTSAPIYLVLQNRGNGIIWNVQTAPDVTLAHVAIVTSRTSGLVSPPDNATFEALLEADFVPLHEFGADDTIRTCMIRPWRLPEPDWLAMQKAGNDNQIYSYTKGYTAYNAWYTGTLGVDAATNLVSPQTAAHMHFGPLPASPFTYRSMAGRDVHMMRTDHMFSGDPVTLQATIDALHGNLLRAAIGGDLALLDPAPVERPQP